MFVKSALLAAALAVGSSAQNSTMNSTMPMPSYNVTFLQGLASFLGNQGLTSLAQAVTQTINSTGTLNLLNNINGTGRTLLAPNNAAFTGFMAKYPNSTNPEYTGDVLSYHLLSGTFNASTFSIAPNHTVARTFMNDSAVVQLEGGKGQAMVFAVQDNVTHVLNQNTNVTVLNTTMYENLLIHIVDAVVDIPHNVTTILSTFNLTAAATVISGLGLVEPLSMARGFTAFIPSDQAFAAVNSTIAQLAATNMTQVQEVLANHIVNGSTIYSTELGNGATSAGGQSFSFASNSTGTFVTSGNFTAQIVIADVLVSNGVVHVIDHVLLNNATNTGAATSAYSSATAAAATNTAQETAPIGNNVGNNGSGGAGSGGSSGSGGKSAGFHNAAIAQAAVILAGIFAGAVALL